MFYKTVASLTVKDRANWLLLTVSPKRMCLSLGFLPLVSQSSTHFLPRAEPDKADRPGMQLNMDQIASLTPQNWVLLPSHVPKELRKEKSTVIPKLPSLSVSQKESHMIHFVHLTVKLFFNFPRQP